MGESAPFDPVALLKAYFSFPEGTEFPPAEPIQKHQRRYGWPKHSVFQRVKVPGTSGESGFICCRAGVIDNHNSIRRWNS